MCRFGLGVMTMAVIPSDADQAEVEVEMRELVRRDAASVLAQSGQRAAVS